MPSLVGSEMCIRDSFTTMANPENKNIMKIKAFNGLAQVILRSRKGESGKVTLQVISNGLKPAQTTVTVK